MMKPTPLLLLLLALSACHMQTPASADDFARAREAMVKTQLEARGIKDLRVLAALGAVPRHELVPPDAWRDAYDDSPLPIGYGQTISQPYIVAFMTEQLGAKPESRVLEIGTGSGYQAAVLSRLVAAVYSIEIVEPLARRAIADLARLGCENVHVRAGDGYRGWPEAAPFDAIIVTCAPERVPEPLVQQLREGGRIVVPVGGFHEQSLYLLEKRRGKVEERDVLSVRFVPMTGEAGRGAG